MILRGSQFYQDDPMNPAPVAERIITRFWHNPNAPHQPFFMPIGEDPNVVTLAYVNDGRWVADCPWCGSAVVADPDDPRFFCVHCKTGTQWVRIVFPDEIEEIEEILDARDLHKQRSWTPGESVELLRIESAFLKGELHRDEYLKAKHEISGTNVTVSETKQ